MTWKLILFLNLLTYLKTVCQVVSSPTLSKEVRQSFQAEILEIGNECAGLFLSFSFYCLFYGELKLVSWWFVHFLCHPLYSIIQVSLRCIKTMFDAYHFAFYFIFPKENWHKMIKNIFWFEISVYVLHKELLCCRE